MALTALLSDAREYFTMSAVETRARAFAVDERRALRVELTALRERRAAFDALWTASCSAQALRLPTRAR